MSEDLGCLRILIKLVLAVSIPVSLILLFPLADEFDWIKEDFEEIFIFWFLYAIVAVICIASDWNGG